MGQTPEQRCQYKVPVFCSIAAAPRDRGISGPYGRPIWAKKDVTAWSIPKGVVGSQEEPLAAAIREFFEETGFKTSGEYEPLGTIRQNSSKDLTVWALEGGCDPAQLKSNMFSMEWPPKSGQFREFPKATVATDSRSLPRTRSS